MTLSDRAERSRFDKDVAWSAFAMLVPIAVGFVALPLLYKNVHQQAFTAFLLFYGAVSFAPGLDLGVARTAQRRIAYATSLHAETRFALVRHSLRRGIAISLAAAILTMFGAFALFPRNVGGSLLGLAAATGIGVGFAIYSNCQRAILEGLGAFSRSGLNRAGVGLMLIGAPVCVSFVSHDPTILSLTALSVRIPFMWEQQRAIASIMALHHVDDSLRRENLVGGFLQESGWFALLSFLAVAMSGFDRYILIGLGGLANQSLAVFLATQDLALRAIAIPSALLPALTVRLAANEGCGRTSALSRRLFIAIVPGAVLGCTCAALLSNHVVSLLYPQLPQAYTATTLDVLLVGIAASAIAQFPMARLVAKGRARDAAIMHLIEFATYLVFVPTFIHRYEAIGAAALWSGRIIVDAVVLVGWSAVVGRDRLVPRIESGVLIASVLLIAFAGKLL